MDKVTGTFESILSNATNLPVQERIELIRRLIDVLRQESPAQTGQTEPYEFLKILKESNIAGPNDWSENHNQYTKND